MKQLTYSDTAFLVGDDAAEVLLEYAAALSRAGSADTVTLQAINAKGVEVGATFLLDQGIGMLAETSLSDDDDPDNSAEVQRVRRLLSLMLNGPVALTDDTSPFLPYADLDLD